MALLQSTQNIVNLVEKLSDRPVHITEDPSIKTLATMVTARGDAPMHMVRYQPRGSSPPDYFIAYQCGFVVRLYMAPPEKRFDVGSTPDGKRKIDEALLDQRIPREMRGMGDFLLNSLITQLRTYPIGLRVDQWIFEFYPELRGLQKTGIQVQLEQNVESIKMSNSGMFPGKVVKANLAMNAAFALFWSRKWNQESLTVPWKAAGLLEAGTRLLAITDGIADDSAFDMELIDAWASELGLNGWYGRTRYTLNP